jgi:hypothetical protein
MVVRTLAKQPLLAKRTREERNHVLDRMAHQDLRDSDPTGAERPTTAPRPVSATLYDAGSVFDGTTVNRTELQVAQQVKQLDVRTSSLPTPLVAVIQRGHERISGSPTRAQTVLEDPEVPPGYARPGSGGSPPGSTVRTGPPARCMWLKSPLRHEGRGSRLRSNRGERRKRRRCLRRDGVAASVGRPSWPTT